MKGLRILERAIICLYGMALIENLDISIGWYFEKSLGIKVMDDIIDARNIPAEISIPILIHCVRQYGWVRTSCLRSGK